MFPPTTGKNPELIIGYVVIDVAARIQTQVMYWTDSNVYQLYSQ